jgi:hypothetical protein
LDIREIVSDPVVKKEEPLSVEDRKKQRVELLAKRRALMQDMMEHGRSVTSIINDDKNIRLMRKTFT